MTSLTATILPLPQPNRRRVAANRPNGSARPSLSNPATANGHAKPGSISGALLLISFLMLVWACIGLVC